MRKQGYGFPILADVDKHVSKAFGVMRSRGLMVIRSVYVLDPDSRVFHAERGQGDFEAIVKTIREAST